MKKTCPRCGAEFECRHDNMAECHCASVQLTQGQLKYISELYQGCLCHECLLKIKNTNI